MSTFKDLSRVYDALYRDKDYGAETRYVDALIRKHRPGARTVLDIGCGTGKHALALMSHGYQVTGVDRSAEMIAIAQQAAAGAPGASFAVGDATTARLGRRFDVVTLLFHVMSYLTSNADLRAAAETIAAHLSDDSLFLFDFWHGPGVFQDPPTDRVKRGETGELKVERRTTSHWAIPDNRIDVRFEFEVTEKRDGSLRRFEEVHPMRYFFQPELRLVLENAGLEPLAFLDWMSVDRPLSDRSWYGIVVGRKARQR